MSVVEDRLSGFLLWPFFCEGILIPQWGDHPPLLTPYLRQAPLLGLAFPLLRTPYKDVFWRISLLPFELSGGSSAVIIVLQFRISDIWLWYGVPGALLLASPGIADLNFTIF